jgi:hypothetical protein
MVGTEALNNQAPAVRRDEPNVMTRGSTIAPSLTGIDSPPIGNSNSSWSRLRAA